jgi:hypothetical protein
MFKPPMLTTFFVTTPIPIPHSFALLPPLAQRDHEEQRRQARAAQDQYNNQEEACRFVIFRHHQVFPPSALPLFPPSFRP